MEDWQKGLFLSFYGWFLAVIIVYLMTMVTGEMNHKAYFKSIGIMTLFMIGIVIVLLPVIYLLEVL